ncbi:MAG: hypothetical protein E7232_07575 [Lachnospiraceae bacterium]|nr:hypothetical protein [Lachnospiraceae bacterium]
MTKKENNKLRERISKIKQILMIVLMLLSGIWYVTMGRAENKASYKLYSESPEDTKVNDVTKTHEDANVNDITKSHDKEKSDKASVSGNDDSDYLSGTDSSTETIQNKEESSDNEVISDKEKTSDNEESYVKTNISESDSRHGELFPHSETVKSSLVNINKADLKELESIPGVGPATAKNIIEYREKYGGFADINEIKNVKRIGDKTYEKLKDYITV